MFGGVDLVLLVLPRSVPCSTPGYTGLCAGVIKSHSRLTANAAMHILNVAGVVPEVPGRARSRKVAPEQIGLQRFQSSTSRQAKIG